MVNIERLLERYLEEKGIDALKIDTDIFDCCVSRIEEEFNEFVKENFKKIASDWVFTLIEQELDEHPEWKLKEQEIRNENK